MERVFFVKGSEGGVGRSVGAISHLDEFEMTSRKVSLAESNAANPNDGNDHQKGVISFFLVGLGVSAMLNLYGAAPERTKVTVQSALEKSQPKAATDSWTFENSASCQSRTRLRDCCGSAFPLQGLEQPVIRKTETSPVLPGRGTVRRLMADHRG